MISKKPSYGVLYGKNIPINPRNSFFFGVMGFYTVKMCIFASKTSKTMRHVNREEKGTSRFA